MDIDIWDPIKRSGHPDMINSSKGKILVSGTHNDTRFMMRVLLEMWGYDVAEADGEEETVRMAESYLPNVILVDTSRLFDEDIKVVVELRVAKLAAAAADPGAFRFYADEISKGSETTVRPVCWPSRWIWIDSRAFLRLLCQFN